MRNAIGKFLLLVALGVVAIACKDNKPKTPSTYKIEINIEQGEKYAHIMDSVEILYYDKDFKAIPLQRVPYNNGKFTFELEDTIKNEKLKTIVEYYSAMKNITFNPMFTVDGAMFSSGVYVHVNKNCEVTMDKVIGPQRYVFNLKLVKGYNFIQNIQSVENGMMKNVYTTQQQGKLSWSIWQ